MHTIAAEMPPPEMVREAILTPSMLALSGTMVAAMGSFYLLLSATPSHAATLGGDLAAGLTTGALMAMTIVGELVAPRLIAHLGRRAAMAAALLVLALPCFATFSSSLFVVLASCAARGLGLGILLVAACGLAASLAPPSRRAEAMGVYGVASAIPAILGIPLGPWMLTHFGPAPTAIAAVLLGVAALLGLAGLPRQAARAGIDSHPHALPALRGVVWPTTSLAIGAVVVGATITFLPLAHREATPGTIMLALLIQGLASAAARWAAGRPIDRHGPQGAMIIGVTLAIVALLCLALPGAIPMLAGMVLSGVAFGLLQSASLTQLLHQATPAQSDGASAIWNAAYDAGLGVGGLAFGALATATGYSAAFVASAVGLSLLALCAWRLFRAAAPQAEA